MPALSDNLKVVPYALVVGMKMAWNLAKLNKKAQKAGKIFEKTLKKEGLDPDTVKMLSQLYMETVPTPRSFMKGVL